jgi:NADH dehydrogenase
MDVVTGAFSYSGGAIASALIENGRRVRTMTGHPNRAGDDTSVEVRPLDFDDQLGLVKSLEGATTLYNTYWVRFARSQIDHDLAVANSRALFQAARRAGVQRIVHVSITHPSIESPLPYFRGKALVERAVAESGVSFAVLRPAILFGGDGVLLNNIAWLLRHLPVFAVGGRGDYRIRGIHIDDLAELALAHGAQRQDSVIDAVGPERPTFLELVGQIREAVGSRARIIRIPGAAVPPLSALLGLALHDVLLTKDEYAAMSGGLADTDGPATGSTRVTAWLSEHADDLGLTYANEIQRHFAV